MTMSRNFRNALGLSLTRRKFTLSTSAAVAATIAGTSTFAQSTPTASPAPGTWPRTVSGTFGDVVIEAEPLRVVALSDWYEVDYLVAQGVTPVLYGYTNRYGQGVAPWLSEAIDTELETYDLEGAAEPDLELILAAKPDVIIADPYIGEQIVDQLNAIAPTVGLPTPYSGSSDWRDGQIVTGQATGDEEAASAAIAETEAAIAAGREALAPHAGRTVTIAYTSAYNGGSLFYALDDSQEAELIRALGLEYRGFTDGSPQSLETINHLENTDIVISYDSEDNREIFEGSPLFHSLPIATNGNYEVVTTIASRAIFAPTTLSVRWVVPQLVEVLTRAAEGNGRIIGQ